MPSSAASTWKTLTTAHQRSLFSLLIYLLFFSPPSSPPLTSPKRASHGHKPSFGWYRLTFLFEKKSGFTVPPGSLTNFLTKTAENAATDGYILFSCEWITQHETHSRMLIGSDDICLSNNWFKSTCCGCRTRKLSHSHLSRVSVAN